MQKCGVNTVDNIFILGFYLEDKYKEIVGKLPQLAAMVSELMSDEGLEVDGVRYTFKVTFGVMLGDAWWVVCFLSIVYALLSVFHICYKFILLFARRALEIIFYDSP
jgi:hypothetical protein